MLLKLDDDLAARYDQMAQEFKQPLQQVIERQLARFADYPATVRVLPVGREHLQQIEHCLGGGQIATPQALVDRIKRYASVSLGTVLLDLTAAQKAELVHRAKKRGVTPEVVVQELVTHILDTMFDAVTPYR